MDHLANPVGAAVATYHRGRPGYPATALDWLLPPGCPRVVDLGAGTGQLSRSLWARGLPVTAVDPNPEMLAVLSRVVPAATTVVGSAESIPLPDASTDVVLVAQAWHRMDPVPAVAEVARVLAPGGRLGLLRNVRDESCDWVRRLGEILGSRSRGSAAVGAPFGSAVTARFAWTSTLGAETLMDLVASRQGTMRLPPDERAAVLGEVRKLVATHPQLVGRTEFSLPYVTECVRADLP